MNGSDWMRRAGLLLVVAALAVGLHGARAALPPARAARLPRTGARADASAADTVSAFYTALAAQQYAAAYALLSPALQAQQPYASWLAGYASLLTVGADITALAASDSVAVYLTVLDQVDLSPADVAVTRYSGTWTVVPDGAGGWLLDSANIGVAAEPAAYATTAADFTAFTEPWHHHDFALLIDAAGDVQESSFAGAGGLISQADLALSATFGSSAVGTVLSSTGATTLAPGALVSITRLPFDMAVLVQNGSPLVLCGAQPSAGVPLTVRQACGA
jgi:hypothetical protein